MAQAADPDDYVLATGTTHGLDDFLALAFSAVGIDDWAAHVVTRDDLRRTTDPAVLRGNSAKAYARLGWQHTRTFPQIAQEMADYDVRLIKEPQALWHEA